MERKDVYKAFDTERDFQDRMTAREDRPDMIDELHVGDALTAIRVNLQKAESAWYSGSVPHEETTEYLRKIAGIITKIGETYGIPERK